MADGLLRDTPLNWADTPPMDGKDFDDVGGQAWRYDQNGVFLRNKPDDPVRSGGKPVTVTAILAAYGSEVFNASIKHKVPPELIVMTIATETADRRDVNFTGPRTFRWEPGPVSYSGGPMQVLETTARDIIAKLGLDFASKDTPPHFPAKPDRPPSSNPLYDGDINITLGTGYIRLNRKKTGLNPILVAACYNAGNVKRRATTPENPWGLVSQGNHLNRAAEWFGDACTILSEMRKGTALDADDVVLAPSQTDQSDHATQEFELNGLTQMEAKELAEDYRDSGAVVDEIPEMGGFVTLIVTYSQVVATPPPVVVPPPAGAPPPVLVPPVSSAVLAPDENGYVICIDRKATQLRSGKAFRRTIGLYQAFFDKQPIAGMSGTAVERQGPGDNTNNGVLQHRRLKAGTYPLFTHAGDKNKYRTFGFANPGGLQSRPWPSIRVGNTDSRSGVLIHCAAGYLMSIGCINLTGRPLGSAGDDIEFFDSRGRVIDLIQSMKTHLGNQFPSSNNVKISNAMLVLRGEP